MGRLRLAVSGRFVGCGFRGPPEAFVVKEFGLVEVCGWGSMAAMCSELIGGGQCEHPLCSNKAQSALSVRPSSLRTQGKLHCRTRVSDATEVRAATQAL